MKKLTPQERELVTKLLSLLNAADGLMSAIEGTTDQFEEEVQALCTACTAAEAVLVKATGRGVP